MDKIKNPNKVKEFFKINSKRNVFWLCISIVLVLFFIICLIEQNQIVKEITVLRYEKKYKQTQDCADLINLVVILQDSKRDTAKIKYSKALIDSITEEGIHNSILPYDNVLEYATPYEIAIDLYLFSILSAKEYELYVNEFVDLYPKLSFEMRIMVDGSAPDNYSRTKDIKALEAGVKANKKLSETTDDEILRHQCNSNVHALETVMAEIEASSSSK
ncbi:MAG: hypothetical protein J1F37_01985 [Oscillospiraceae bacterium]|nr:hypothetical protein [Oscillospiraceae bacterium]